MSIKGGFCMAAKSIKGNNNLAKKPANKSQVLLSRYY